MIVKGESKREGDLKGIRRSRSIYQKKKTEEEERLGRRLEEESRIGEKARNGDRHGLRTGIRQCADKEEREERTGGEVGTEEKASSGNVHEVGKTCRTEEEKRLVWNTPTS